MKRINMYKIDTGADLSLPEEPNTNDSVSGLILYNNV